MRSGKILATSLMAVMLSSSGSLAQSSNIALNALGDVQVVIEAPNIAVRQSVQELIEELTAAGFTYIEIHSTFLGRARIIAYSDTEIREVIINPTTGEVLRDLAQESSGTPPEQTNTNSHANAASESNNKGGNSQGNGNSNNGNSGGRNNN
ncbi:hypothetical protein A9Q96_11565 [Rhodobacterales bacterium 52_120_T64]|nr:hypothetical protein A9Q96_11565 [Rhodobacterales bacterium 52_120_T64]